MERVPGGRQIDLASAAGAFLSPNNHSRVKEPGGSGGGIPGHLKFSLSLGRLASAPAPLAHPRILPSEPTNLS